MRSFFRITALSALLIGFALTFLSVSSNYFEISKNLDVFATLYKELNMYYVDEIEPAKVIRKGIDAMLESLDPYTNFISETEIEDYRLQTTGKYGGIGAMIRTIGEFVVITEPYEGFPAHQAGLLAGDVILTIDGISVKNKNSDDISKMLKGQAGTQVQVKVKRLEADGTFKEIPFNLQRQEIKINNVPYFGMIDSTIGYIKLANFTENAGKEVKDAFEALRIDNPQMRGLIFDLRGNPGGLLNEAVNVANIFIPKNQEIVSTRGKNNEWDKSFKTLNNAIDTKIPLVILTSRTSASASEIVAGAVQDLDRGVIVGQRTFGKGLVQTTRNLSYNTRLKVTTAKYYIPSGRCIQSVNYNERDENGNIEAIPDSLKTAFKTAVGRVVYDGGGVEPDVSVESEKLSKIAISLLTKNHIFDFATLFRSQQPSIDAPQTFKLTAVQMKAFREFLKGKEYDYTTQSEQLLAELKSSTKDEMYFKAIADDLSRLEANIRHDKEKDLQKFEPEIQTLLEEEILSRYYFTRGRIEGSFRKDPDVLEAKKILSNPALYQSLLSLAGTQKK